MEYKNCHHYNNLKNNITVSTYLNIYKNPNEVQFLKNDQM